MLLDRQTNLTPFLRNCTYGRRQEQQARPVHFDRLGLLQTFKGQMRVLHWDVIFMLHMS